MITRTGFWQAAGHDVGSKIELQSPDGADAGGRLATRAGHHIGPALKRQSAPLICILGGGAGH